MKPKPKVGQWLYRLNVGNNARNAPQVLVPVKVTKVGRKYFDVALDGRYAMESQHYLANWRQATNYSPVYVLYESPQEWEDQKEETRLSDLLRRHFQYYRQGDSGLESLRTAVSVLGLTE